MNPNVEFLPIDEALLLQRIEQGGRSGEFLAAAFISAYRMKPFKHSLGDIVHLDHEAVILFHGILHMRNVHNWSDDKLFALEQKIKLAIRGR